MLLSIMHTVVDGRLLSLHNDTTIDAAAADEGSASSLSLCGPVYSKLNHQIAANSPANRLHPHHQQQQQPVDHIPRSHERQRHPYWAVESIRQALSSGSQSPVTATHSQLHTPSLQSDTAAAAAGVVASGNSEMRDQATNTDITSECKLLATVSYKCDLVMNSILLHVARSKLHLFIQPTYFGNIS